MLKNKAFYIIIKVISLVTKMIAKYLSLFSASTRQCIGELTD